jgi:hypothetical protein
VAVCILKCWNFFFSVSYVINPLSVPKPILSLEGEMEDME